MKLTLLANIHFHCSVLSQWWFLSSGWKKECWVKLFLEHLLAIVLMVSLTFAVRKTKCCSFPVKPLRSSKSTNISRTGNGKDHFSLSPNHELHCKGHIPNKQKTTKAFLHFIVPAWYSSIQYYSIWIAKCNKGGGKELPLWQTFCWNIYAGITFILDLEWTLSFWW